MISWKSRYFRARGITNVFRKQQPKILIFSLPFFTTLIRLSSLLFRKDQKKKYQLEIRSEQLKNNNLFRKSQNASIFLK